MDYTQPGAAKKENVKKTRYVNIGSRVYWLTFALTDEASHAGEQDTALTEQIMKTVVLK